MIVPSRSRKTAGHSASLLFAVPSKTGDEFISRHSRRSKFAYDYSAGVVCDLRRFNRSGAAHQSQRKERDCRVACARHIKNLTSLGADGMRRVVLLEKHHPVFAKRHQDILSFPFFKKCFSGALKISVFFWSFLGVAPRNPRCKKCFSAVRFDNCNATPVDRVSWIRIGRYYFAVADCLASDFGHQFACYKALAVIFKNNGVGFFDTLSYRSDCLCDLSFGWGHDFFAIDTDHLLMQGDNPGFDDRVKTIVFDRAGCVDLLLRQELPKLPAAAVVTEHSDYSHLIDKFAQVPGDVGRPAGIKRFSSYLDHRNRRFR